MRYLILVPMLFLAACGPRYDAGRQCYQDAGGYWTSVLYTKGGIIGNFNYDTPEGRAYNQQLKDCMARYDAAQKAESQPTSTNATISP
jgi:hypothetical protein